MTYKVLIGINLNDEQKSVFESIEDVQITYKNQHSLTKEDVLDKDIIVGNIAPSLVQEASSLKFLQLNSAGYDNYMGILPSSVKLATAVGAFSPAVGEHMLAMTFSLIRHFHLYRDKQLKHDWSDCGKIISVENSTVAVLGLGDIGQSYAAKIKALGAAKVIGVRRNVKEKPDFVDSVYTLEQLDKVLPQADIVAMVLPSTKQTVNLINEKTISMMKDGAYLINVGRGDAINQEDLLKALRSGKLAGAALDVTKKEPLDKDDPLYSEPKVLLTPHVAGWFFLDETVNRIVRIASSNVKAFIKGLPLINDTEH